MEKQKIIKIFEKEIKRHKFEIGKHKSKIKIRKHHHKLFQTKLLAKQLGLEFCECCGKLHN